MIFNAEFFIVFLSFVRRKAHNCVKNSVLKVVLEWCSGVDVVFVEGEAAGMECLAWEDE